MTSAGGIDADVQPLAEGRDRVAREIRRNVAGKLLLNEPLASHTSFRVGGPARLYHYPESVADLATLLKICGESKVPLLVIGFGTNLLVSGGGFDGLVIDLATACRSMKIEGRTVNAAAGVWGNDVVRAAAERGLGGMEKLAGIPGGLGGLLRMNGGAFRTSISDHLVRARAMTFDGKETVMSKDEIGFAYRSAPGFDDKIIISARFELPEGVRSRILDAVEETIRERFRRNVMTLPSAGSVFKNPPDRFAAKLLESVGAKGMHEGGVEVSQHHANFIVNTRGGTAADIVRLIARLRARVQDAHGVTLALELKTLGFGTDDPGRITLDT